MSLQMDIDGVLNVKFQQQNVNLPTAEYHIIKKKNKKKTTVKPLIFSGYYKRNKANSM